MCPRPPPPTFDFTPVEILECAKVISKRLKNGIQDILKTVALNEATYANTIDELAQLDNEYDGSVQVLTLLQSNAPDENLREVAAHAIQLCIRAYTDVLQNEELFRCFKEAMKKDENQLDGEAKRLTSRLYKMFTSHGMELNQSERKMLTKISDQLIQLRLSFVNNISRDPGGVWKSEKELVGLYKAKLESLEENDCGLRRVTFRLPDITAVLRHCDDVKTRRDIWLQSQATFADNVSLFREIIQLRHERARLLGWSSYAVQQLNDKMAKSPEHVRNLLSDVKEKLIPRVRREIDEMKTLSGRSGDIMCWDKEYYHQKMLKERHVDHDRISEYFPADHSIAQMMSIFEQLFDIRIQSVMLPLPGHLWHPDVKMFAIHDARNGQFLAYLYTDIYPRPGKYNHAANFNIWPVRIKRFLNFLSILI